MRHGKKIILQTALVALILLLTVGLAAAWLINYKTNQINASQITISGNEFLQISTDGNTWDNSLSLDMVELDHDVTGDGINLYRPTLKAEDDNPGIVNPEDDGWTDATKITLKTGATPAEQDEDTADDKSGDYVEIPLHFRSGAPVNVYLGKDSYVSPHLSDKDKVLQTKDTNEVSKVENPSSYSTNECTFSRNYIAGAVRVAVLEGENDALTRKFIWVPNADFQFIDSPSYSFKTGEDADAEKEYNYYSETTEETFEKKTWNESDIRTTFYTDLNGYHGNDENSDTNKNNDFVVTLQPDDPNNPNLYTAQILVRIWVEGTDREARLALAGGQFDTNLQFIAIADAAPGEN